MKKNLKKAMLGLTTLAFVSMPVFNAMAASTGGGAFDVQWSIQQYFTFNVNLLGNTVNTNSVTAAPTAFGTIVNLGSFDAKDQNVSSAYSGWGPGFNAYVDTGSVSTDYVWTSALNVSGVSSTPEAIQVIIDPTQTGTSATQASTSYITFGGSGLITSFGDTDENPGVSTFTTAGSTPSTADGSFSENYDMALKVSSATAAGTYGQYVIVSGNNN